MPVRLALDYDGMTQEDVEQDAQALLKLFPQLKNRYKVEPSQTPTCWHVIFPLSEFKTFEAAADAAEFSKCDKNWLALCRRYRVFGIRTEGITKLRGKSKAVSATPRKYNRPSEMIPSPIKLFVNPVFKEDIKRLVKVSEAIDDPTWLYKVEQILIHSGVGIQLVIGCKDKWQAERRVKFLEELGIAFTHNIKP